MGQDSFNFDTDDAHLKNTTHILYDPEIIRNKGVEFIQNVNERMDICVDTNAPSIIVTIQDYFINYAALTKRGCKIRFLTEITKDNLVYCKEIMKVVDEFRHLDNIKGGIAVSEKEFMSTTQIIQKQLLIQCIYSNIQPVVEQGQYIFDSFWSHAFPAMDRIKELEKGVRREFIETIRNPTEIEKLIKQMFQSSIDEVLIILSNTNDLHKQNIEYIMKLLTELVSVSDKIRIKLLMHRSQHTHVIVTNYLSDYPKMEKVEIHYLKDSFKTNLMLLISDKMLSLAIEIKTKEQENLYTKSLRSIGLATYSNSEPTVSSFLAIFENLWIQSVNSS
ncbi:hypothetical protein [Candidatus Nitrosocosmicus sp. R]